MSTGRQKKSNYQRKRTIYIGVSPKGRYSLFEARITKSGKRYNKTFRTETDAAEAYDKMAIHLYGPLARINFIDNLESYLNLDLSSYFNWFTTKEKTSKHIGVCLKGGKWWAYVYVKNKPVNLGLYDAEGDAAKAVLDFKIKIGRINNDETVTLNKDSLRA